MMGYPKNGRNVDPLKRKFMSLHRPEPPTGDPMIPNDVLLAKRILQNMTERADRGNGEEAGSYVENAMPSEQHSSIGEDFMDTPNSVDNQMVAMLQQNFMSCRMIMQSSVRLTICVPLAY